MYIIIERVCIFHALQNMLGFIGGIRPALPILGHLLLEVRGDILFMIGTDIDTEIIVSIPIYKISKSGKVTVSARKLFDICRTLSENSKIILQYEKNELFVFSEGSRFSLITYSPEDFPIMDVWDTEIEFIVSSSILRTLIELTQFAMGKRDVRYYLNGMLFEFDEKNFSAVATDGHRLAYCIISIFQKKINIKSSYSIIVPRKYIINMIRMLNIREKDIQLKVGKKNLSMIVDNCIVTSKLINGVFPDYKSVFLQKPMFVLEVFVKILQQAIKRAIILCNEKFHIVRFVLSLNKLKIISNNFEHEQSEQILDVIYSGKDMEVGFNIYYILDILNVIRSDKIQFLLIDENSSVQVVSCPPDINTYIIMPIRL